MPPWVSVIVVSYQSRDLLRRCLATLRAQEDVDLDILVVDNASSDGSADMVARDFPEALLIRNPENAGFATANNQGLARARGDILALVNPDTELPADALRRVADVFTRHPDAGVVGAALRFPDGSHQASCLAFPGLRGLLVEALGLGRLGRRLGVGTPGEAPEPRGDEGRVDCVSGAFFVMARRAYEHVGGLNEMLFMYGEEPDWCWRARREGFRAYWTRRVLVTHHGGAAGHGLRGELFVLNLKSRLSFLRRYRGAWRASIGRELMCLGAGLRLVFWWIRAGWERARGRRSDHTRDQLERFAAVVRWRMNGAQ